MAQTARQFEVYLEAGKSRTFASAVEWPGWSRSARDEASALQALCDYGPRYARALRRSRLGFRPPSDPSAFVVVERLTGNATTDFGAPGLPCSVDALPVQEAELRRLQTLLRACWRTFDAAVRAATGKTLTRGPRGGGRDLVKIVEHVRGADAGYLSTLGGQATPADGLAPDEAFALLRDDILATLAASARGEIPPRGPRGGVRWAPRYFVRRMAWHELDHAWEIEDRAGLVE